LTDDVGLRHLQCLPNGVAAPMSSCLCPAEPAYKSLNSAAISDQQASWLAYRIADTAILWQAALSSPDYCWQKGVSKHHKTQHRQHPGWLAPLAPEQHTHSRHGQHMNLK
jgi:hypothetical protein